MMLKWTFMGLAEYDLVLHLDADVDALPIVSLEGEQVRGALLWG